MMPGGQSSQEPYYASEYGPILSGQTKWQLSRSLRRIGIPRSFRPKSGEFLLYLD